MVSKNISNFQENNLKSWVFVVFDDVKEVQVKFNFVNDQQMFYSGHIEYNIVFETQPSKEKEKLAQEHLNNWVKHLFWSDTKLTIKNNGKKWM